MGGEGHDVSAHGQEEGGVAGEHAALGLAGDDGRWAWLGRGRWRGVAVAHLGGRGRQWRLAAPFL